MKKDKEKKQQSKEFSITPFKAMKGFRPAASEVPPPAPAKTTAPVTRHEGTDDDDLFLRAMADVRKLKAEAQPKPGKLPSRQAPLPRRIEEEEHRLFIQELEKMKLDVTFQDELPDDVIPLKPLPVNRMRQLRRGAIRINYELDLHGLTREEALESLAEFINSARTRGQKAVLIITGKGNNSEGEPVLVGAVAGWLRDKGKGQVAEFSPAPRQLGGGGAFVVFLKDVEK